MSCNLEFDFHSPHNNEYWYRCTTCGETDWFSYYSKPKKTDALNTCKNKEKNAMKDTDWRPSPCPACGEMREAARRPVCRNVDCVNDVAKINAKMSNRQRYLWIRPNSAEASMVLIDDPVVIFRGNQFDESVDKLYELGPEVRLKVTIEAIPPKSK